MTAWWMLFYGVSIPFRMLSGVDLPAKFDLRDVNGKSFVSSVKDQDGGTCWTHGTMAAMEGNLMMSGLWAESGQSGEPNLAEYHLDWWNGFNEHFNKDIAPSSGGLTVHEGGDYRVAAAYLSRGGGAVREVDGQSFFSPPKETKAEYKIYYPRHIEWMSAGSDLNQIARIKSAIFHNGVVGTALTWSDSYYSGGTFYQPPSSSQQPNHAVALVGWDDAKKTKAPLAGAWLVKNSWGKGWGQSGYFWISYYDKIAGQHPEMGAVSFRDVEPFQYTTVYSHDYHGWRDTKKDAVEAFNAFTAQGKDGRAEKLKAVSLYTTDVNVEYTIKIYRRFEGGVLSDEITTQDGVEENSGYHTVDLNWPVSLSPGEKFYVYTQVSRGGQAFDRTSDVPVLLGSAGRAMVESRAKPGESFFKQGNTWVDLTTVDKTANFCLKAFTVAD